MTIPRYLPHRPSFHSLFLRSNSFCTVSFLSLSLSHRYSIFHFPFNYQLCSRKQEVPALTSNLRAIPPVFMNPCVFRRVRAVCCSINAWMLGHSRDIACHLCENPTALASEGPFRADLLLLRTRTISTKHFPFII